MTGPITMRFQVQSVVFDLFHTLVDPDVYRPEGFTRAYKIAEALGLAEADQFARYWDEVEAKRHVDGSKKVAQYADDYLLEPRDVGAPRRNWSRSTCCGAVCTTWRF